MSPDNARFWSENNYGDWARTMRYRRVENRFDHWMGWSFEWVGIGVERCPLDARELEAADLAFGRLPERLRRVWAMRSAGFAYREIAASLDVSPQRAQQLGREVKRRMGGYSR